ncbi:MAG TPA: divalent-cation tolerance protein CutA [Acidimicrobiales bacterium]
MPSCQRSSRSTPFVLPAVPTTAGEGGVVQLTTTVERQADADRIAALLLERRLAACVQVAGPVTSHYRWKGEPTSAPELLVVAKTTASRAGEAVAAIVDAHPYDLPEVLVTPVAGGHAPYLAWVAGEVESP